MADTIRDVSLFEDAVRRTADIRGREICESACKNVYAHLDVEIVKRSDRVSGFVVLPKRWIVERTIAWLNRCRRACKDWENLNRKALAFLAPRINPLRCSENYAIRPEVSGRTLRK